MANLSHRYSVQEKYELIMECRRSGLTDAQWCLEHDIRPSTFYNWVSRLRRKNFEIPPISRVTPKPSPAPDIVRMEIITDPDSQPTTVPVQNHPMHSAKAHFIEYSPAPIEITVGTAAIRITNDVDPRLFMQIIRQIGGLTC